MHPVALGAATLPAVSHLGRVVNEIGERLSEGAAQLNSVTDEACRRLFYVGPDGYLQGQTAGEYATHHQPSSKYIHDFHSSNFPFCCIHIFVPNSETRLGTKGRDPTHPVLGTAKHPFQ